MQIHELTEITELSTTDYAAVDNGSQTRKVNLGNIVNSFYLHSGSSKTYGEMYFGGFIGYSAKAVLFSVPLGVICESTPTIEEMTIVVRSASGITLSETQVIAAGTASTGFTLTSCNLRGGSILSIRLSRDTSYGSALNNTPVTVTVKSLTVRV